MASVCSMGRPHRGANAVFARLAGTESGALAGHRADVIAGLDTNMGAASRVVHELERRTRLRVRSTPSGTRGWREAPSASWPT